MAKIYDSYKDKYAGVDFRNSIVDILSLVGTKTYQQSDDREYEAVDISEVKINGNRFTNYGQYSFIWEKTFVKSPERSSNGSISNLNSYATFMTPHLIINFSVMSIDDYRKVMKLHYGANEFTVECYDPIYDRKIKAKMYFATEEMAKLYTIAQNRLLPSGQWEDWIDLVGVTDYNVELIGTNNDLDLVSVRYLVNAPTQTTVDGVTTTLTPDFATDGGEEDVYMGEDILLGSNTTIPQETFASRKKFINWNTEADGSGLTFLNGYAYTINENLNLYAQWDDMTEYTLTYNYGLADPEINEKDYTYVTSIKVTKGNSIGVLPTVDIPTVKYKDISSGTERQYTPYGNGKWYKTPIKAENSVSLTNNALYWADRDSTIYLLYDVKKYDLTLYLGGSLYQKNSIEYNTPTNLPQLVQTGCTFDGWYYTSDYQNGTKFSGNMPPYGITLYARWIKV